MIKRYEVKDFEKPLITIIGAASPSAPYDFRMGYDLGYELRENLEFKTGTIVTGGVSGVGLDVFLGALSFCKLNNSTDSKFFSMFPHISPANPYYVTAAGLAGADFNLVDGGKDMLERREKLVKVADYVILVNGSEGTLGELKWALYYNKPIFSLETSGGIAKVASEKIKGPLFFPCESIDEILETIF